MPPSVCVDCGKPVEPAQSFIREDGLRCGACDLRRQVADDQDRAAGAEAQDLDRSLSRRARRLGRVHGLMWVCVVLVLAGRLGPWWSALILPAVALAAGLAFRRAWAYHAALALNAGAVLAGVVWGVTSAPEPLIPIAVTAFPIFLIVLVRALRVAFVETGS